MVSKYGNLTSETDIRKGSEYGGVDGIIQPPPHDPANVPREQLMQVYQTNPTAGQIVYKDGSTPIEDQPIPQLKRISR